MRFPRISGVPRIRITAFCSLVKEATTYKIGLLGRHPSRVKPEKREFESQTPQAQPDPHAGTFPEKRVSQGLHYASYSLNS